jgi:pilus assembly protein TadC
LAVTAAVTGGLIAGLLAGWPAAVPIGLLAAAGLLVVLRRAESPADRRERLAAAAQLPMVADLLAAALRSGAAPERAALVVGEAVAGPVGSGLVGVSRALRIGLPPAEAWARLAGLPGADRMARAAVRSAESGLAMSRALDRLADDLRCDRAAAADAAVRRASVLAVLPLGLCFLPAFLLTGVVPVIVSVSADIGRP